MTTLVWFRDDLRLTDHPALHAAAESGDDITAVYILDEQSPDVRPLGAAARWWLHHSLESLADSLARRGVKLILRRGAAGQQIHQLARESEASSVVWNRRYGGGERAIDTRLKEELHEAGIEAHSFPGNVLFEPWTIQTNQGQGYKVFTPFWRACLDSPPPDEPLPAPGMLMASGGDLHSDPLGDWQLLPTQPNWATGIADCWQVGEAAALDALDDFLEQSPAEYGQGRDHPARRATSGLSPYLRWGEISPRTIWHRVRQLPGDRSVFLSEVGWRDFAWHTLYRRPEMPTENLDARFDHFGWDEPREDVLKAWRRGETGVPLVDAGMRELWATGVMHNRVRMVCASYFTKNLLLDWRIGEEWFWDTLVDADQASNPFNWQWVAGSGVDASPYFRIFNPVAQAEKFDPQGHYIARWAPGSAEREPLIDLKFSRERALAAFEQIKGLPRA